MKRFKFFPVGFFVPAILATFLAMAGCVPRSESEVVVYASVDRDFASPILDAFERAQEKTKVAKQYDIEASKTVGLASRIFQESNRPRCDVFWNGEILNTIRLQKAGLLKSHDWNLPLDWPKEHYAAADGSWVSVGARARVLLVNRGILADEKNWPTSVSELADSKWKKKCGIAKPLFGTTATHFLILAFREMERSKDKSKHFQWMEQVAQNAVVLSGNKQVAQAVSSGQLVWGLTDTDDAQIEIDNGANVAIIYPDQKPDQVGCLLIPSTVAVLKNSPNPVAALSLASYLASASVESRLTLGNAAAFAFWPENEKSIRSTLNKIRFMDADFESAAGLWESTYEKLQQIFH